MKEEVVVRGDILAGRFGVCSFCWGGNVDVYMNDGGEEGEGEEGGVDVNVRKHNKRFSWSKSRKANPEV